MSRNLLFVLLLVTGVALADTKPGAKHATGPAAAQKKTAAVRGQTEEAQAQSKAAQVNTEKAQAETEEPQGQSEKAETEGPSEAAAQAQTDKDGKLISVPGGKALGMSVLGNQEAPTSLVIVPWKTSEVGRALGISPMLDDSRQPVDKEVFMRALRYYEIRSETKP
ncbi:MAG TPA: hypothetical protein VE133_16895 [Candidatus Sulfotelmatobacter sp.]|nr:hypothetical protein [Candidatus Sulfotelmatobacter sp.]